MKTFLKAGLVVLIVLCCNASLVIGQDYFNAWLTSDAHLIGPTGNPESLQLAVDQARGKVDGAPAFSWDIQIDAGDWIASQPSPTDKEGDALAKAINKSLGKDRGKLFTISGNHDGDRKGWNAGYLFKNYVNPLGEKEFSKTSGFSFSQRPSREGYRQLLKYSGTRWDRYLVRTGNVIWIMLSDRNEYDTLAEQRGDSSGSYQAGRGSASGMPDGGYPSGAVTLDTFNWWKKVVQDPKFSDCILITVTHMLPAYTTIATGKTVTAKKRGRYHGETGSIGPDNIEIGGQLYWIREYNDQGEEINQYAQTRPFLNYFRDHPGAISAWVGGHTHVEGPETKLNGRGIYVRKYGVTFLNVAALTDTHGGGANQMTRMLSFQDGKDGAMLNVYIHKSKDGHPIGWYEPSARRIPLGKKFKSPDSSSNVASLYGDIDDLPLIPDAPTDPIRPRYYWNLNEDHNYDFNNETYVVGADGSPYGNYQHIEEPIYTGDSPMNSGRSLDLRQTNGRVQLNKPYQPEMNWRDMTLSVWLKTNSRDPQEVISYSSADKTGKFRLWYDGTSWVWDVADDTDWKSAKWEPTEPVEGQKWHHFVAIVDSERDYIQLYVDGDLVAEEEWSATKLNTALAHQFVIGASGELSNNNSPTWSRPFHGLVDEVMIFDTAISPEQLHNIKTKVKD